jgi:hypothetical protein
MNVLKDNLKKKVKLFTVYVRARGPFPAQLRPSSLSVLSVSQPASQAAS